jgi:hypothetical protein
VLIRTKSYVGSSQALKVTNVNHFSCIEFWMPVSIRCTVGPFKHIAILKKGMVFGNWLFVSTL